MDETVIYLRATKVIKLSWEKKNKKNKKLHITGQSFVKENNPICIQAVIHKLNFLI